MKSISVSHDPKHAQKAQETQGPAAGGRPGRAAGGRSARHVRAPRGVAANTVRPQPPEPNRLPLEQLRLLGRTIRTIGRRAPVVVSRSSGLVVKGHGRLEAAKLAGLTVAPVDIQDYASDAEETADVLADIG